MVKDVMLKTALATAEAALTRAVALIPAPTRAASSIIAAPTDFQHSPYAQPAPLVDLTSKSGLLLYTDAQEALKVPFNGKAANVQPFLNSLALEVKKYCLDSAVQVTDAAGDTINLLTHHGSFSDTDAAAFFNTARHEQITGITIGTMDKRPNYQFTPARNCTSEHQDTAVQKILLSTSRSRRYRPTK